MSLQPESGEEENVGQNNPMESTTLKSKLFVKNEKAATRRTSEGMTLRARGGDDSSEPTTTTTGGGGGGAGTGPGPGGGGGDLNKKDTKIEIPLPPYMQPSSTGEKFADKRVKVSYFFAQRKVHSGTVGLKEKDSLF